MKQIVLVVVILIAIGAVLFVYGIIADRVTPYTTQGLVRAYIVKIAPEVGGRVVELGVSADQRLEAGRVLFRIDPHPYLLAVRRAEAQLESAGQSFGASTGALAAAQAKLIEALAKRQNIRDQTARDLELEKMGIYPGTGSGRAHTTLDSAEAAVVHAEAELEKAHRALGPHGAANSRIREALTVLAQANLDLRRTTVLAPFEGGVTNLSFGVGQLLVKGETAMTFIDIREVWVEAAFRENSLERILVGNPVEIVLDVLPGRVISGRVTAIAYGVDNRSDDVQTGVPGQDARSGRFRSPQSIPVRVEFNQETLPVRVGSQASVMVYSGSNPIMNAIGVIRMRLVSLLAYVQ